MSDGTKITQTTHNRKMSVAPNFMTSPKTPKGFLQEQPRHIQARLTKSFWGKSESKRPQFLLRRTRNTTKKHIDKWLSPFEGRRRREHSVQKFQVDLRIWPFAKRCISDTIIRKFTPLIFYMKYRRSPKWTTGDNNTIFLIIERQN